MKILQIITRSDTVGGAQKHVYDIASRLQADGHIVNVLSSGNGPFRSLLEEHSIPFVDLEYMKREVSLLDDLKTLISLRRIISKFDADVVSIHSVKAGLLARLACIGLKNKVIYTAHGWSHIRASSKMMQKIYGLIELTLSKITDTIICVSKADYEYANKEIGISNNKLNLVQNAVHLPTDDMEEVCDYKQDPTLRLLSVVRFQAPKDFDTLLDALALISKLNWHLTIIGDGKDVDKVNQMIADRELIDNVCLDGFQHNTAQYYRKCDAVILISKSEGLPMSLLEAMSYSKLLIASSVGGIPELVQDGVNGYLIRNNDVSQLVDKIEYLVQNKKQICKEMGSNSYKLFINDYCFDVMMKRLYSIYLADST